VSERLGQLGAGTQSANHRGAGETQNNTLAAELRALLAEQETRRLQEELRSLRLELDELRRRDGDEVTALFSKVGLHPNCPDFLVRTAQRSWRKEFHPDALSDRPARERKEAEERFKEIDNVFDQIDKVRQSNNVR
jgi:uncharacterized membrane protein